MLLHFDVVWYNTKKTVWNLFHPLKPVLPEHKWLTPLSTRLTNIPLKQNCSTHSHQLALHPTSFISPDSSGVIHDTLAIAIRRGRVWSSKLQGAWGASTCKYQKGCWVSIKSQLRHKSITGTTILVYEVICEQTCEGVSCSEFRIAIAEILSCFIVLHI